MYRAPSNFSHLCSLLCNPEGDSDAFCLDLICSSCKQHPWLFQWRCCKDRHLVGSLPMLCYLVDYDNIKCQLMGFNRINDSIGYDPNPELHWMDANRWERREYIDLYSDKDFANPKVAKRKLTKASPFWVLISRLAVGTQLVGYIFTHLEFFSMGRNLHKHSIHSTITNQVSFHVEKEEILHSAKNAQVSHPEKRNFWYLQICASLLRAW